MPIERFRDEEFESLASISYYLEVRGKQIERSIELIKVKAEKGRLASNLLSRLISNFFPHFHSQTEARLKASPFKPIFSFAFYAVKLAISKN